jgi:general secretion pathway protein A
LLNELNDFLLEENAAGRQAIIIIDEAQNLTEEALEEIRLLSNLEADNFKLVQIILVGQPELKQIIARPSLRQLRQRVSISCHLNPLNREEIEEYIFHRLGTVGKRDCVNFADGVFDAIYRFSGGIPRLINLICDYLLLTAFVEESHDIDMDMVNDAVNELSFEEHQQIMAGINHKPLAKIKMHYAELLSEATWMIGLVVSKKITPKSVLPELRMRQSLSACRARGVSLSI